MATPQGLHPLEGQQAQILARKIALHEAPGRLTDDDRVRGGQPLQPGRDIRGVPQRQLFLPPARPHGTDHHQSRVDAQAHRQSYALLRCQPGLEGGQGVEHPQPGPHRPLGIVFVRLRIAEVHEQAIPEVLGNGALKALDDGGAGGLIGADHLTVIFGVELPGQACRLHQVTKQHRELAPFGLRGVGDAWDRRPLTGLSCMRLCLRTGLGRRQRRRGSDGRTPGPDQDSALFIHRQLFGINEILLEVFQEVVI